MTRFVVFPFVERVFVGFSCVLFVACLVNLASGHFIEKWGLTNALSLRSVFACYREFGG